MEESKSAFVLALPLLLVSSLVMAGENHYYDKKIRSTDRLKSAQESLTTYQKAVDLDEVSVIPQWVGETVKSVMQPNHHKHHDASSFYGAAFLGLDGADLRISDGNMTRSYSKIAGIAGLEGGYRHFVHRHWFVGGAVQLGASSFFTRSRLLEENMLKYQLKVQSMGLAGLGFIFGGTLPSFDTAQSGLSFSMRHISQKSTAASLKYVGPSASTARYGVSSYISFDAPVASHWFTRFSTRYSHFPQASKLVTDYNGSGESQKLGYTFSALNLSLGLGYQLRENKAFKYFYSALNPKGFYTGARVGLDQLHISMTEKQGKDEIKALSSLNQSELLSIVAGYSYPLKSRYPSMRRWFVSGEFDLSLSTPGRSVNDMNSARTLESLLVNSIVGYQLYNNNQYYLKLGSGFTHIKTAKTRLSQGDPKLTLGQRLSKRKTPLHTGLGYQTMVTPKVAVRSEFSYAMIGSEKAKNSNVESRFSHVTALIGGIYYFK